MNDLDQRRIALLTEALQEVQEREQASSAAFARQAALRFELQTAWAQVDAEWMAKLRVFESALDAIKARESDLDKREAALKARTADADRRAAQREAEANQQAQYLRARAIAIQAREDRGG